MPIDVTISEDNDEIRIERQFNDADEFLSVNEAMDSAIYASSWFLTIFIIFVVSVEISRLFKIKDPAF